MSLVLCRRGILLRPVVALPRPHTFRYFSICPHFEKAHGTYVELFGDALPPVNFVIPFDDPAWAAELYGRAFGK